MTTTEREQWLKDRSVRNWSVGRRQPDWGRPTVRGRRVPRQDRTG